MPGRPNAFTEKQCERIAHLYRDQQLSVTSIADRLESNPMSVWRTLKRIGVEIRYNPRQSMNHAQRHRLPSLADVRRLYTVDLLSSTAIAERYGCHAQSIRHMLKGAGVTIRGKQEAALLSPSEWTDERVAMLRDLWMAGVKCDEIKARLGISYTTRAVSRKADELGLPKRNVQPKRPKPVPPASHQRDERRMTVALTDSIISFEPNRRLQTLWLTALAEVRSARQAQGREVGR